MKNNGDLRHQGGDKDSRDRFEHVVRTWSLGAG